MAILPTAVFPSDVSHGQLRIPVATIDARPIVADATTGKPALSFFGDNGVVNLRQGLASRPRTPTTKKPPASRNWQHDHCRLGIADNGATDQPSGEVRGFDAASGSPRTWDPIPQEPAAS